VTLSLHTAPEPADERWEELAAREIAVVDGEVEPTDRTEDGSTDA
jgi:hypothetical protein